MCTLSLLPQFSCKMQFLRVILNSIFQILKISIGTSVWRPQFRLTLSLAAPHLGLVGGASSECSVAISRPQWMPRDWRAKAWLFKKYCNRRKTKFKCEIIIEPVNPKSHSCAQLPLDFRKIMEGSLGLIPA